MANFNFNDYTFDQTVHMPDLYDSPNIYLDTEYEGVRQYYEYTFDAVITSCNPDPENYASDIVITFPYDCSFYGDKLSNPSILSVSCTINITLSDANGTTIAQRTCKHTAGYYEITEKFTIAHERFEEINNNRTLNVSIKMTTEHGAGNEKTKSFYLNEVPQVPQISCTDSATNGTEVWEIPIVIGEYFDLEIRTNVEMDYLYEVDYSITLDGGKIHYSDVTTYCPETVNSYFHKEVVIPLSILNSITASKSARVVFSCKTYARTKDGSFDNKYSEYLGKSRCVFDAQISDRWSPAINSLSVEPEPIIEGVLINQQEYLKDVTRARIKVNATTYYGATIDSYRIYSDWRPDGYPNINEEDFNFERASVVASGIFENDEQRAALLTEGIPTSFFSRTGYYKFYVVLTDSRGFVTGNIPSPTFYYVIERELVEGTFDSYRCNSSGTYDEEGRYAKCICDAIIHFSDISSLEAYVKLFMKNDDGVYEMVDRKFLEGTSTADSHIAVSSTFLFEDVDPLKDYKTQFILEYGTKIVAIPKFIAASGSIIDIAPNGSIAFGKKADDNEVVFDISMNVRPAENSSYNLGDSSHRWTTVYAVNALNTSDRRFKENINYVSEPEQHELHEFYKSKYLLTTYNYKGQDKEEYGFITQDMYDNTIGEMLIIKNDEGDMFSMNSYVSSIAGALQYEINLRDQQIEKLALLITALQQEIDNLKK